MVEDYSYRMIHLCYAYIYEYKVLNDVELVFDSHYSFHFNKCERILRIEPNNALPENFWGAGIYSLSGLIGDNGAGKSTALCFLMDALISGTNSQAANGIIVYEQQGALFIYNNERYGAVSCVGDIQPKVSKLLRINTLYYSGHFLPYSTIEDCRCYEFAGGYNASDGYKLIQDPLDNLATDSMNFSLPIWYHLDSFVTRNNYRICTLLADTALVSVLKGIRLPRIVLFAPSKSGLQAFELDARQKKVDIASLVPPFAKVVSSRMDIIVQSFIYYYMVGAMRMASRYDNMKTLLEEWLYNLKEGEDILQQYMAFVKDHEENDDEPCLSKLLEMLKMLVQLAHFDEDLMAFYLDAIDDNESFKKLVSVIVQLDHSAFVPRFADLFYRHSLDRETHSVLSSGEQQMLNLFSRLYDAIILKEDNGDILPSSLLLLDEAETGFHPEWQRRYINSLVCFLEQLKERSRYSFQVVITSHSPILLSDIPGCCTNRLRVQDVKTRSDRDEEKETFASNVFDLYRDYFSMQSGLIGCFAEERIQRIQTRIKEGGLTEEEVAECQKEIDLIGDPRIRTYLCERLARRNKQAALNYYLKQIEYLESHE